LSDNAASLEAANRAIERATRVGAELLLAEAQVQAAYALAALGEPAKALVALDAAETAFTRVKAQSSLAWAKVQRGQMALEGGDFHDADRLLGEALRFFREVGDAKGTVSALISLGISANNQAHAEEGMRVFR